MVRRAIAAAYAAWSRYAISAKFFLARSSAAVLRSNVRAPGPIAAALRAIQPPIRSAPAIYGEERMRQAAKLIIYAGDGCDSRFRGEPINHVFHHVCEIKDRRDHDKRKASNSGGSNDIRKSKQRTHKAGVRERIRENANRAHHRLLRCSIRRGMADRYALRKS